MNLQEALEDQNRKFLLEKGYSENEVNIILQLEEYCETLNQVLGNKKSKEGIDFISWYEFIDKIQSEDINEKIKTYSEYLKGASLPLYDEQCKREDLEEPKEFEILLPSKDWVSLMKTTEDQNIDCEKLDIKVKGKFREYYEKSNYKWVLAFGYYHWHWIIEKRELMKYISDS